MGKSGQGEMNYRNLTREVRSISFKVNMGYMERPQGIRRLLSLGFNEKEAVSYLANPHGNRRDHLRKCIRQDVLKRDNNG